MVNVTKKNNVPGITKKTIREGIIFILITSFSLFWIESSSLAQDQPKPASSEPLILAPAGLSSKEQAKLERQYRQTFRQKDILLSPYISGGEAGVEISDFEGRKIIEQEKLYRYFGVASSLYKAGRIEEAVEILKYITYKNPDDEYVKNYLNKLEEELKVKEVGWDKISKRDAELLKNRQARDLTQEGLTYYKQKRFDMALVKFADALSLEPNNQTAKSYMDQLKDYYLKEVRVENIVQDWQEGAEKDISYEKEEAAEKLLSEEDKIEKAVGKLLSEEDAIEQKAEEILNKEEMEFVVTDKRAFNLLDQTELGFKVEDIVLQLKEDQKKSKVYLIGPGDVLQISVRDHPELSGSVQVKLKGEIVLPLTNEILMANGLTLEELTEILIEKIKRYVKEPAINVAIIEYKSHVFYVVDETGCAPYPITRANFTIRDALFAADWGSDRALGRVLVIKPSELHPIIKKVDAFDIIYRGRLVNNIRIENGDVIYIPMTAVSKISTTLTDIFSPVASGTGGPLASGLQGLETTKTSIHDIRKWREFPQLRK